MRTRWLRRRSLVVLLALVTVASPREQGAQEPPPPPGGDPNRPVWNARVSYEARAEPSGGHYTLSALRLSAEYQVTPLGLPVNATIHYSAHGFHAVPGTPRSQRWSVSNAITFKSFEELQTQLIQGKNHLGDGGYLQALGLPAVLIYYRAGERVFMSGEWTSLEVSITYPDYLTDINGHKLALHLSIDASDKEPTPGRDVSEAQEEARAMKKAERILKKLQEGKTAEVVEEARKEIDVGTERSGAVELTGTELQSKVVQGSRQWTDPTAGEPWYTHTVSWHFSLIPEDLEVVMWAEPSDPGTRYEEWLPQGGTDETQRGDLLRINVKLQVKDKPQQEVRQTATFRFELADVSTEPGVAVNWPPPDRAGARGKGTPDLAIEDLYNPGLNVTATWETKGGKAGATATTKKKDSNAEVLISSFDWGAWGALRVYAELDGRPPLVAYVKGQPSVKELKLPKDDNGNHIADMWEKQVGVKGKAPDSDDDFLPKGDGTKGDGLSLYEEYRGFMVLIQGMEQHQRTNPKKKTLFVDDQVGATPGIDLFRSASGLEVEVIPEGGMDSARVVNFNHKTAHVVDQHGLWMTRAWSDDWGGRSHIGPPKYVDKVQIAANYRDTVAHELGHAVGMPHHGKWDYKCAGKPYCQNKYGIEPGKYGTNAERLWVAVQQGQTSGGFECIMRYRSADLIERTEGGQIKYYPYGNPEEMRTAFCRTDRGTKRNTKTGDATGVWEESGAHPHLR